ncbi:MAG: preprotein translocase subunit YajC [Methylocapsa sp.]|nr:preprotein translocase subunit YajC [Methylocapsa sp.]
MACNSHRGIAFTWPEAIFARHARRNRPGGRVGGLPSPESRKKDLFTSAFAQAPAPAAPGAFDALAYMVPFAIIIGIVYILVIRPQRRREKQQADMLKNVRRGDIVVMSGGLIGKVSRVVDDHELELEIAPNVRVRAARAMISDVRAKSEPVKGPVKGQA